MKLYNVDKLLFIYAENVMLIPTTIPIPDKYSINMPGDDIFTIHQDSNMSTINEIRLAIEAAIIYIINLMSLLFMFSSN